MLRFATICLCAGICVAQAPADKPPAGVDEALRARVTKLFQLFVDQKYREVEALVAEDSKDAYYNSSKPHYLNFELKNIEYSDNFTRAKATVTCEIVLAIVGFAGQSHKFPVGTTWRLVNGEWFWYIDPESTRTPFGTKAPAPDPHGGAAGFPAAIPTDPSFALGKVRADKTVVNLKPGGSAEITLTNSALGLMSISLMGRIPSVDVKLDRVNLNAREKAVLTVQANDGARSGTLSIQVDQTNEVIPIQVNIEQ
jgi:hypothetical protein